METVDIRTEELFWTHLAHLGNEAKRHLIELLASSLTFTNEESKENILEKEICGAWDDGVSAEYTINNIKEARAQGITRELIKL